MKISLTVLLITSLLFISCFDLPDEVILPEWDVELNIPLTNKTYTLEEIIKTQETISIDTTDSDIFLLQSGKYYLNSSLSEFVQINETSTLANVPTPTSQTDGIIVYVRFPQELQVDSCEFAEGSINLEIDNPSSENVSAIITMPAFFNSTGEIISIQTDVEAGGINSVNFRLSGYKYKKPSDQPFDLRNSFRLIIRAVSEQQGNIVYTNLSMSDLSFEYITGIIPSKSLGNQISSYDFDVDQVEEYRNKSYLRDAKLNLKANYLSAFNAPNIIEIRNLNIIGRRNDGTEFYLRDKSNNSYFTIRMIDGSLNAIYNQDNSNINDFITFFPDSVILRAEYVVNPDNNDGTFSNLDSIEFQTNFSTRSYLALKSTKIEDETAIEISERGREEIRNGIGANINLQIENGIPLQAWVKMDLLDENNNYLFSLIDEITGADSISFDAASVNNYGEVIEPRLNPVKTISLDESQIQLFSNVYSLRYRIRFNTTDSNFNPPQIVAIRPSNWLKVKTYGKVNYRVRSGD